ncbi:Outer membrane protein OmpA [Prevotella sp. KH2C16]|nr:Outer membrane protein OmpA [Prevotella sp. KH2C16]
MFAAALMAVSVNAQTVEESKTFDNFYIGINGGVATKMTQNKWLGNLNPNAGLRIGRWFTPVFGLAAESNAYFSNKPYASTGTVVRLVNTSLLGTVNLSNWFGGYPGEPRAFEVVALYGLGWGHLFGNSDAYKGANGREAINHDNLTSKAGLDFTFNLGANKAWQIYVEPAVVWGLNDRGNVDALETNTHTADRHYDMGDYDHVEYNINKAMFQLNAGIVYKFGNSNGTHNFKIAQLRDQAEIDALNSTINDLRDQLSRKPKEVVKEVVKEVAAPVQEVKVENLVFVTFAQGKSALTKEAKKALDGVAEGKHVQIVGTASPEGSKEINDKLSQARADVVASYLKNKGVVVDEALGKGVQGTTSNRLAIVYVK